MKKILIEDLVLDYGFRVWSDLTIWKIDSIEGVVSTYRNSQAGYVKVFVDKRHSLSPIRKELVRLANDN